MCMYNLIIYIYIYTYIFIYSIDYVIDVHPFFPAMEVPRCHCRYLIHVRSVRFEEQKDDALDRPGNLPAES